MVQTQTILPVINPPVINTPDRPVSLLLGLVGRGSMERSLSISDGLYGFWWIATAGEADCSFRLVLEGADGPKVLDDYGRIDAGQSAGGLKTDARLEAGSFVLVTDTNCPGEARLLAWRYDD